MISRSTKIAFLGTGIMGAPMVRNLLRDEFGVRVWNRTQAKAHALAADGAYIASTPAEAAAGAGILVTMLSDGAAVEEAMTGDEGALSTLPADAVWVQMSTVGAEWTQRLAELADRRVDFVDAPVSGSSVPAERGELVVLASGAPGLRHRVQPLFDVVGRRTLWLDRLGDGSRLKLVLNNWLAVLVEGMAESLSLATALGLDPTLITDTVEDSALNCAFAVTKGRVMIKGDFAPGFPLRHAHKDIGLAAEAADRQGAAVPLTEAILRRWSDAIGQGHGDDDVASAINAVRPSRCG